MKKKWRIAAGLASLLLFAGVAYACFMRLPPEPIYRGKPLGYWMTTSASEWNDALSAIGTNAVPYLAKALTYKESLYSKCLSRYGPKLPAVLVKALPPSRRTLSDAFLTRLNAVTALMALGSKAEPARSALHAAVEDEASLIQQRAIYTLKDIGLSKESVRCIARAWHSTNALRFSYLAVAIVKALGPEAKKEPGIILPVLWRP